MRSLDEFVQPGAPICYGILMPGPNVADGVPIIEVKDLVTGRLNCKSVRRTSHELDQQYSRSRLRSGDIILGVRGSVGGVAVVPECLEGANISRDPVRIRVRSDEDAGFIYQVLCSPMVQLQLRQETVGQAVQGINVGQVRKLKIPTPPREERRQLARLLETWDTAIRLATELIRQKQGLRKGLAQHLLSGRLRFAEFSDEWSHRCLQDVTEHLIARNKGHLSAESVKAVNRRQGLIPMKDNVRAASLDRYKRVPPKAFAYNPMRLNIGSITMSEENADVLVSPDYVVFRCRDGEFHPDYLNHLRRTHAWKHFVNIAGNGSVRVRIYYKDLAAMPLHLPSIEEQRRIASVLNACDQEIRLLKAKLELLKEQKKGLMQQLLTGKIRVKEATA